MAHEHVDAVVLGDVVLLGGGDSGGWYWLSSSGNRYAYGIHSRSDGGCHGSAGGNRSWYTAIANARTASSRA